MNNELNNEMNNGLNDTNKVSRKLTITKNDLLEEVKRILAEQGTGMDHIFKKQVAFNLGTEYKGIVEEKKEKEKEEKEKEQEEDKEEDKTSNHEGLNNLLGMYSKYKELRATVEEILKQPNHPFYDITTVEEVFDCLTFNEVDEMVFTFNENKNVVTDS